MKATQYTIIQRFKAAIAALCMVTGFAFVVGACSNPVGSHPADSNPGGSTKPDYPPDYGSPTIRVSFDLNGGEGQPPQAQLVIGGRVTLPHLPAGTDKATIGGEEYQFSGWSKERQAELVYTPGTVFPPENEAGITANTTLYAVWYRDSGGEFVQVTFHPNFEGGDEPVVQRAPPGVAVVFPPSLFQRDGYEFLGWDRNKDAREAGFEAGFRYEFDDAETEIDVYAVWSKIVWLKFHPNGVEGTVFTAEVRSGDDYTIQNNTFTPAEFYDFSGWDKNSGATIDGMLDHPVVQDVDTITIKAVTEDTMLYAIWNRPEFTVSFEPGADGAGSIEPVTKPRGEVITLPGNDAGISRDGYIVSGWADKNDENILYTLAENSFAVVRNITLVPMWRDTEAQEIEVSFDADGGVPVDAAVTPIRALQGETITLLGAVFQRDAEFHAMSGWARVRGAAVPDYELSETITLAKNQADFTLYAVWYRPEFAVTFDANGGTAPAGTVSISGLWGSEIPLHSGTGFSREHWDLAGWHTDMAGTAGSHGFYALGGEFVVPRNGAALYAVWTRPDVPVSFHANFPHGYTGSGTAPGNMAVPRGDNILLPGAGGLSVPFHRFDGWSSDPAALSGAAAGEEYQVLNDLDLYAVWNITENPGISISGPDRAMRGSTGIVFTAVLSGGVSPSDIVWKVNGNHDNTAITGDGTASGILNIGDGEAGIGAIFYESESEGSLTVSASAVFNGRSFESQAEITLYGKRMLGDWRLVKIGQDHTLAISWTGELYSWGRDNFSQLGRTGAQSEPGKVGDHNDWIIVGGALEHTLGIRRDGKPEGQGGTLWAWGRRADGRLGLGGTTTGNQATPVQVGVDDDWVFVAAGSSTSYGLKSNGELFSWGAGSGGQIGDGFTSQRNTPVKVGSSAQIGLGEVWRFNSVSSSNNHAVAIRTDNTLWVWGNNTEGQIGDNTISQRNAPVIINHPDSARHWVSASAGDRFTVAIDDIGVAYTWGRNNNNQLGRTVIGNDNRVPGKVQHDTPWLSADTGVNHVLAIDREGRLYTWGQNEHGQSTGENGDDVETPRRFAGTVSDEHPGGNLNGRRWISVNGGGWFSLAVREDGQLWAWGANDHGQLAVPGTTEQAKPATPPTRVLKP